MAIAASAFLLAVLSPGAAIAADILITVAEASLPDSPDIPVATRSGSFGPEIELVAPGSEANLKSPLPLQVKFISRGAAIDQNSFRLYYLKLPVVDLTDRVKPHLTSTGVSMPQAEVPPGTHVLRFHLRDMQGRMTTKYIKFTVAAR